MQGHKKYCMKLLLGYMCQVYYETYEFMFRFGTHPQDISLYVYIQIFQVKKFRRLLTLSISDKKYLVCSIILSALELNMNGINKLYVIDIQWQYKLKLPYSHNRDDLRYQMCEVFLHTYQECSPINTSRCLLIHFSSI